MTDAGAAAASLASLSLSEPAPLSLDELVTILSHLCAADVTCLSAVCSAWRVAANDAALWQKLADDRRIAHRDDPPLRRAVLLEYEKALRDAGRGSGAFALAFLQDGDLHVPCAATGGAVRLRCAPFRVVFSFPSAAIVAVHASTNDSVHAAAECGGVPLRDLPAFSLSRQFDEEAEAEASMATAWYEEDSASAGLLVDEHSHHCWWFEAASGSEVRNSPLTHPLSPRL